MEDSTTKSSNPNDVSHPIHLDVLDGVRGVTALYVLLHHAWLQAGLGFYLFGHFAVGVFITLSGFCLMLPVVKQEGTLRGGALKFYLRRARRILPPYYAALVLSIAIGYLLSSYPGSRPVISPPTTFHIVGHLFLLQDTLPTLFLMANPALWTISVEWRIYFFLPMFVQGWREIGAWATTIITVLSTIVLFVMLQQTELNVGMHGVSPQFLGLFVMGTLAAGIAISPDPKFAKCRKSAMLIPLFVLLSVGIVLLAKVKPWTVHYTDYFVGVWASCLLVLVSTRPQIRLARVFTWKPLVQIGTFAYSLYLIHMPLLQMCWLYGVLPFRLSNLGMFLALLIFAVPLIVCLAYGFFVLFERPFLRRP